MRHSAAGSSHNLYRHFIWYFVKLIVSKHVSPRARLLFWIRFRTPRISTMPKNYSNVDCKFRTALYQCRIVVKQHVYLYNITRVVNSKRFVCANRDSLMRYPTRIAQFLPSRIHVSYTIPHVTEEFFIFEIKYVLC